jgi:hypothetical protein|tara:strand:- start:328 stop:543 length:216 start_codon:yes stop_codon:yes gene_type:complete
MTRPLPPDLEDAYAWVEAAGELDVLRQLSQREARQYATACAGNFDGDYPWHQATVTRDAVLGVWAYLTDEA